MLSDNFEIAPDQQLDVQKSLFFYLLIVACLGGGMCSSNALVFHGHGLESGAMVAVW